MKVKIKGGFLDILSFVIHINRRKKIFRKASADLIPQGKMNLLSRRLHPDFQEFTIESIILETGDTRTYRLKCRTGNPALFIPGQYVSVEFRMNGSTLRRPFSISSSPDEAVKSGIYDITVKLGNKEGLTERWIADNWKEGLRVITSGPSGTFYRQRLRDSETAVCIAGGSGITPFRPIVSSVLTKEPDSRVILFQGAASDGDLIFSSFWLEMSKKYPDRFFWIPVLSNSSADWDGETGFISAALIKNNLGEKLGIDQPEACSFYICGPEGLHRYMDDQLKELNLPRRRIRREEYAVNSRTADSGKDSTYSLTVRRNGEERVIEASSGETVLVALERAGMNPPSLCRTGECGWCRSRLISGEISAPEKSGRNERTRESGLRKADEKFGYFHPCSVFPEGDLLIEVPEDSIGKE